MKVTLFIFTPSKQDAGAKRDREEISRYVRTLEQRDTSIPMYVVTWNTRHTVLIFIEFWWSR